MSDYPEFVQHIELFGVLLTIIIVFTVISMKIVDKWFKQYYCKDCQSIVDDFNKRYVKHE